MHPLDTSRSTASSPSARTQRQEFLRWLVGKLAPRRYVALKRAGVGVLDLAPTSDLDLLVEEPLTARLLAEIGTCGDVSRVTCSRKPFMTTVGLFFRDESFLQLDLLTRFERKGLVYLDEQRVLDSAQVGPGGIKVPGDVEDFEYVWLFYLLNGAAVPERYRYAYARTGGMDDVLSAINSRYGVEVRHFPELLECREEHRAAVISALRRLPQNRMPRRLARTLRYAWQAMPTRRRGLMITVSGVDGAGKSTVLDHIQDELAGTLRRDVIRLRHRPGLLPIISSVRHGRTAAEALTTTRLPRTGTNRSTLSSLLRYAYYLADYLIGQVVVQARHLGRGRVVLYDRYYFDFIADPERSNIRLPAGVAEFLYRLIAKPDISILLTAAPERILARKQELDRAAIEELSHRYVSLFERLQARGGRGIYVRLENEDLAQTLASIRAFIRNAA